MPREKNGKQKAALEGRMVQDIEEFGSKLHRAGLSKESRLRVLDQREVPITRPWPAQNVAPGGAELTNKVPAAFWAHKLRCHRKHGRVEVLADIAASNRVLVEGNRSVETGICTGRWLTWHGGANRRIKVFGNQCGSVQVNSVALSLQNS